MSPLALDRTMARALAFLADGSLLVADDAANRVWRVSFPSPASSR
jgi:glucose/arabinose dehydrogenase